MGDIIFLSCALSGAVGADEAKVHMKSVLRLQSWRKQPSSAQRDIWRLDAETGSLEYFYT